MVLEPDIMILHRMVSEKDIYLNVSRVNNWEIQISCLAISHPRHKMYIPMCGYFKE